MKRQLVKVLFVVAVNTSICMPSLLKAQDEPNAGMGTMRGAPMAQATPEVVTAIAPLSVATLTGRVDHVASGVGLRNSGSGTIRFRGAPSSASVELATLYFGFICSGPCPLFQTVNFQSTPLVAIRLATAAQPCWVGTEYGAYSVDVTPQISPGINDDYSVGGVPSGLTDGSDPWATPPVLPLAEGASLVVVYSDPGLSPGVVYINDGAVFFAATVNINNPLSPPAIGNFRRFTTLGADGQVGPSSTFATPDISGEKTFIGPTPGPLTQIAGSGSTQDLDSDWNGSDGGPLNQLWDTRTHSFNGIIPAGATSYTVQYQSFGDCMDWTAHVLTAR